MIKQNKQILQENKIFCFYLLTSLFLPIIIESMRIYYKYLLHLYWAKFTNGLVTDYSYSSYVRVSKLINELRVLLTSQFWCSLSEETRLCVGRILCGKRKFAQYARILDDNNDEGLKVDYLSDDNGEANTLNFSSIFDGYEYASNLIRSCGGGDKVLQNKAARILVNKQIAYCDAEISIIHDKIMTIMSEVLRERTTTANNAYYSSNKTAARSIAIISGNCCEY